jgi:hypothetical protein
VSTESLQSDLKAGKTIAEVAKAKGVSVQKVIDAMVAAMSTQIDSQVKAGRLTTEQATRLKANLEQMITDQVNGTFERPDFRGKPGGGWGPGPFGPGGPFGSGGPAGSEGPEDAPTV